MLDDTQLDVLDAALRTLEEASFYFAQNYLPFVLHLNGWGSPVDGELTKWINILITEENFLPDGALKTGITEKRPRDVFGVTREIRHCAVHRDWQPECVVEKMLDDAHLYVRLLGDENRSSYMAKLCEDISAAHRNPEAKLRPLQDHLAERLSEHRSRLKELLEDDTARHEQLQEKNQQIEEEIEQSNEHLTQLQRELERVGAVREGHRDLDAELDEPQPIEEQGDETWARKQERFRLANALFVVGAAVFEGNLDKLIESKR